MIFYISIRPINLDGKRLLSPKYMLNNGFRNLPLSWECICSGTETDGRWLYEIETDTLEHRDVILEGLQMWGVHLKTLKSAKVLAEKLLNRKDVVVLKDKLVIPDREILNVR